MCPAPSHQIQAIKTRSIAPNRRKPVGISHPTAAHAAISRPRASPFILPSTSTALAAASSSSDSLPGKSSSVVGDPSHLVGAQTDCHAHVRMSCAQESSSLRHRNTPSAATLAVGASPLTCSLADERKRYPQCCAHAQSRHEGASSAQASLTQSSAPRTRSRNERARGALLSPYTQGRAGRARRPPWHRFNRRAKRRVLVKWKILDAH